MGTERPTVRNVRKKRATQLLMPLAAVVWATWGFPQTATQEIATVYFYRSTGSALQAATVNIDGQRVCNLSNKRFFKIEVPAGRHVLSGPDKKKGTELELEAGKTYYFNMFVECPLCTRNIFAIHQVSPEQANFEMKSLRPLDERDVKIKTLVPQSAGR